LKVRFGAQRLSPGRWGRELGTWILVTESGDRRQQMMQWVGNRLGPAGRPVGRVTFYRREVAEAVRAAVGGGGGAGSAIGVARALGVVWDTTDE